MRCLIIIFCLLPAFLSGQSNFSFSGYTAGRTWTTNAYAFSNTQNGYTMTAKVSQNASPGWMNVTGANSPNNATYAPTGCSTVTGLFLATDRSATTVSVSLELGFSPAVCGPVTFRIYDINGEDVDVSLGYGFRDDVTISAYDQNNTAIALSTAMVTNNGSGSCNGGSYGTYTHTTGNSLKVVGCTYDNCDYDYFTISSPAKMISRIVIDYASGNKDWYGSSISNPNRQWIIISDVRAWTPAMNITANCGTDPILLTGSLTSNFPPASANWGIPNTSYPAVPAANRPTSPTYSWTGTEGTFTPPAGLSTSASGINTPGTTVTLTGQNNKGCSASRNYTLTIANCLLLPVELLNFSGRCLGDERIFNWSTATETNSDRFELEQSSDAINFSACASQQAAGNSYEHRSYEQSIYNTGGNYFRLKQIDFDGGLSYSPIIYVACAAREIAVYPNPAVDLLTIAADKVSEIILHDVTGRMLLHKYRDINLTASDWVLDISSLAAGIYQASFLDDQKQLIAINRKVVKL